LKKLYVVHLQILHGRLRILREQPAASGKIVLLKCLMCSGYEPNENCGVEVEAVS
jgi:hypothetical protein